MDTKRNNHHLRGQQFDENTKVILSVCCRVKIYNSIEPNMVAICSEQWPIKKNNWHFNSC